MVKTAVEDSPEDVKNFRKRMGLREVVAGDIPCLRCDNLFKSKDKTINRMCECCQKMVMAYA